MKNKKILIIGLCSILGIAILGGGIAAVTNMSSINKQESKKSAKVIEPKKERKQIEENEAGLIANDMIDYMHYRIYNELISKCKTDELLWSCLYDYVFYSDIEEVMDDETYMYYKEISKKALIEVAKKYGKINDDLPNIDNRNKKSFSYNKETKMYRVDTNSDVGEYKYELIKVKVIDDNSIEAYVGYIDMFTDNPSEYESIYKVRLEDMYPDKEEFTYYISAAEVTKEKYSFDDKVIYISDDSKKKEDSLKENINSDKEVKKDKIIDKTISIEKMAYVVEAMDMSQANVEYNDLDIKAKLWYELGYYIASFKEYEKYYVFDNSINDYVIQIKKDELESIASSFVKDFKELPTIPKSYKKVSYDEKNDIYTFYIEDTSSHNYKIVSHNIGDDGSGTIEIKRYEINQYEVDDEYYDNVILKNPKKYEKCVFYEIKAKVVKNKFEYADTLYTVDSVVIKD